METTGFAVILKQPRCTTLKLLAVFGQIGFLSILWRGLRQTVRCGKKNRCFPNLSAQENRNSMLISTMAMRLWGFTGSIQITRTFRSSLSSLQDRKGFAIWEFSFVGSGCTKLIIYFCQCHLYIYVFVISRFLILATVRYWLNWVLFAWILSFNITQVDWKWEINNYSWRTNFRSL